VPRGNSRGARGLEDATVPECEIEVLDGASRPVADAAVFIVTAPGNHPDVAALTDGRGRVVFRGLEPGPYEFGVNAGEARQTRVRVVVGTGTTTCQARVV
jgi:protocatechuate 3,4-dioxygenase beta subunit